MHIIRQEDEIRDVVLDEFVVIIPRQMLDIGRASGDEIVDSDDAKPLGKKPVSEMGAEETGSAGDYCGAFGCHERWCL
jgi:hypothetical protein